MTHSLEEYLKTMYLLSKTNGNIRVTDIANALHCTKPSVNRAIKVLKNEKYINYEAYGDITFTKLGNKKALEIIHRNETIQAFLTQVLEVDETTAKEEAKNMKYAISEDTINKLEKYINSIIDVSSLTCDFDPESEKCKSCVKVTAKYRLKENKKEDKKGKVI